VPQPPKLTPIPRTSTHGDRFNCRLPGYSGRGAPAANDVDRRRRGDES
jgi:hypothetical protein